MEQKPKETRINRWKQYRHQILENHNIDLAIINSEPELKRLLKQVNFNPEDLVSLNEINTHGINEMSYQQQVETQSVNDLLDQIHKNESLKPKHQENRNFNSHKYDHIIWEYFPEFQDDEEIISGDTETTQLEVKKVNLKPGAKNQDKTEPIILPKKINIAIDGPSGVGKSSIAKALSEKLNLIFVNTGLMYRAIAFYLMQQQIALDEESATAHLNEINLESLPEEQIKLNGVNVTDQLWSDDVSLGASVVAQYGVIRRYCVSLQQQIAKQKPGVVMEGRDIGTVVLPNANLKIFLTAPADIRAQRRLKQLQAKGQEVEENAVLENVVMRDETDQGRSIAPLEKAADAIEIDTANLSLEEVINQVLILAQNKMK